jgi:preprotein translocase subunit SecF
MRENHKIDFMKLHKATFALSAFLVIFSIFLVFTKGLNLGIDFSGGVLIEARVSDKIEISKIRKVLENKAKEIQIQSVGKSLDGQNDFN